MKPCANCPFLREGGIRLRKVRRKEIADALRSGRWFACHKTVDYDRDEDPENPQPKQPLKHEAWCAGALLTMDNDPRLAFGASENQAARMAERLRLVKLPERAKTAGCYNGLSDWVRSAPDG